MTSEILLLLVVGAILALALYGRFRYVRVIYPPNVGLLYRNGRFERELEPGRYAFFDVFKRTRIIEVSKAALPVQLGEVTVVSRDQFSFRLGLAPVLEVVDARAFSESQPMLDLPHMNRFHAQVAGHQALHSVAPSAAVEATASLTLREIMAEPQLLGAAVQSRLSEAFPGASVPRVLMTSITLPPETRKMFTEVERSKLEAEAGLERARGEQASLRALANAARLIKDNPALANLRFLQTLEQAPGPKTIVLGSDSVAKLGG